MLSLPHLIVLFVIALMVFGPEKLPELARKLGKATAEFRRMTNDFRSTLEDEVHELERQNRIREEEVAAAARAAQPAEPSSQTPPEGTVERTTPASEILAQKEPLQPPHFDPEAGLPTPPAQPETVTAPKEKPTDDNSAV